MSVLFLFVVFSCNVHGDTESAEFPQYDHYEVDGVVQLNELVNFIQPSSRNSAEYNNGDMDSYGYSYDTRRSDSQYAINHGDKDVHNLSEQIIQITQEIPVPYPVRIEKKVHYPVPIPVEQPVPVHVPQPYPIRIEKKVPVPVAIPIGQPFPVQKTVHVPVEIPIDNPVPYFVYKPVPFYIQKNVAQPIVHNVPLKVEVPVGVNKEVQVPVLADKKVPLFIPKPVPYEIKVPVEKAYQVEIPVPYPVSIENQSASSKNVQITMSQLVDGARYLFQKSAEPPSAVGNDQFVAIQQNG